jgi:hypothetical protein
MTDDQRFASRRVDTLYYQTEPLKDDLTVAGPIGVELWVSTSAGDADWVVKLIDVQPPDAANWDDSDCKRPLGDAQLMVRSEAFRGRFRNSYEKPEPFTPNQPTRVAFELLDVLHTFEPGHRLMVQVQSTWFPLMDRNPQRYVPNINFAEDSDFIAATHRVYRGGSHATSISLPVLSR